MKDKYCNVKLIEKKHSRGLIFNQNFWVKAVFEKYTPFSCTDLYVMDRLFMHHGNFSVRKLPRLHLTYSKNGGNLGFVLKMENIACISTLLTKHVKYTYLYLFKFVLYSIVAFKAD